VRSGEGRVDLFVLGAEFATVLLNAEREEVVFDGADAIETPTVGGDALGELDLHGAIGCEAFHESFGELVVSGSVFLGHGGHLTGKGDRS
jgi:hypothetical protein